MFLLLTLNHLWSYYNDNDTDFCCRFSPTMDTKKKKTLTLVHSERPKLYGVLAVLRAIGLKFKDKRANSVDADEVAH